MNQSLYANINNKRKIKKKKKKPGSPQELAVKESA
jgi:hypothetical protein